MVTIVGVTVVIVVVRVVKVEVMVLIVVVMVVIVEITVVITEVTVVIVVVMVMIEVVIVPIVVVMVMMAVVMVAAMVAVRRLTDIHGNSSDSIEFENKIGNGGCRCYTDSRSNDGENSACGSEHGAMEEDECLAVVLMLRRWVIMRR